MVTVRCAYGFRFVIFANDHSPPHVHVFGHGGEAKIVLERPHGIRLEWVASIKRGDLRKAVHEAESEQERLMAMRRKIHEQ